MGAQPAKSGTEEFNALIRELNDFYKNPPEIPFHRERNIRELKDKARKLKELNIGFGFSVLGSIACLEGDEKMMQKFHNLSIQYNNGAATYANYGASLVKCGHSKEAIPFFEKALQQEPGFSQAIVSLVRAHDLLENEEEYRKYMDMLKLFPDLHKEYLKERTEVEDYLATAVSMSAAESSLLEIWSSPEEDAAWMIY